MHTAPRENQNRSSSLPAASRPQAAESGAPGRMNLPDWMGEALAAAFDVSLTSLGKDSYRVIGVTENYDRDNVIGAYLPMISQDDAVIIGILSNKLGCQELAKYFLQMESQPEEISQEDMADAIREMLNILCGVVKRQMAERHPILKTGLPVFVEGDVALATGQEALCMKVTIGPLEMYVRIILSPAMPQQELYDQLRKAGKRLSLSQWLTEMTTAFFVMTPKTIGRADHFAVSDIADQYRREDVCGAYMPLIGETEAVLLGLISNHEGFDAIARSFMGVERTFQLTGEDTADAIKEILNIISGLIRRQLAEQKLPFHMGLPIFINGYLEVSDDQEAARVMVGIQNSKMNLVVIRKKTSRKPERNARHSKPTA
ncbi:MAG: chemotaxis protein CheX [candidate division FCPU426 bacterium]